MSKGNLNPFLLLLEKFISRQKITRELLIVGGLLVCAVLSFMGGRRLQLAWECLSGLGVPVKVLTYKVTQFPKYVVGYFDVKRENEILKKELNELKIDKVGVSNALKELEGLKRLLNLRYKSEKFNVIEKILGHSKSIFSSNIIISKTHGITQEDSVAMTPDGLVGLVISSDDKIAEILPVTSSKIAVPVKTLSGIHLIISGTDQDKMVSREILGNKIADLVGGDILYTSGEGGVYPKDIPVAKITKIDIQQNMVIATPLVELDYADFVYIIRFIPSD